MTDAAMPPLLSPFDGATGGGGKQFVVLLESAEGNVTPAELLVLHVKQANKC